MARMRIVKPRFFTNEEIAELPPLTRILFIGLWCYADRRGRLEDRPKRIKTEILPYDNHDVDAALTKLNDVGFITRFAVDEKKFIQINNFEKHQHCHVKEPESTIPAPCETGANPSLSLSLTGTVKEEKKSKNLAGKSPPDPRINEVKNHFVEACFKVLHFEPVLEHAKDGKLIKSRLNGDNFTLDELKDLIDWFVKSDKAQEHPTLAAALSAHSMNLWGRGGK